MPRQCCKLLPELLTLLAWPQVSSLGAASCVILISSCIAQGRLHSHLSWGWPPLHPIPLQHTGSFFWEGYVLQSVKHPARKSDLVRPQQSLNLLGDHARDSLIVVICPRRHHLRADSYAVSSLPGCMSNPNSWGRGASLFFIFPNVSTGNWKWVCGSNRALTHRACLLQGYLLIHTEPWRGSEVFHCCGGCWELSVEPEAPPHMALVWR